MTRARDGLYRRENEIFAFRYKDGSGIWREKYTGTRDRQEARAFKRSFSEQLTTGSLPNELAKWRLAEAINYYLEQRRGILAARTLKVHRFRLNSILRTIGDKRLEEITARDIETYQSQRRKSGISAEGVNKELELLRYLLKKARLWRLLEEDYKQLPISRENPRRALTIQEFALLVKTSLGNPDWEAACMASILAANTTCRSWEVKSLRLGDIDLDPANPKLVVRRETTKSNAGAREIELNPLAVWAVQRLLSRAAALGCTEPEHYLFPGDLSRHTRDGDPLKGSHGFAPTLHQQSWRTAWRNMTSRAGLPWVRFHDLRHTAITKAREQGVDIAIVKSLAGHVNARMTEYYTHIGTNVRRDAVNLIAEAYKPLLELLGMEGSPTKGAVN